MKNLSYDVWGETVTLSELHSSSGNPGMLIISEQVYQRSARGYRCQERMPFSYKNVQLKSYQVISKESHLLTVGKF